MATTPLAVLRDSRIHKLEELRQLGISPYPSKASRTHYANQIVQHYDEFEGKPVIVAGRLLSWRKQGGMAFGHIQDQSGTIQLVFRRNTKLDDGQVVPGMAETDPAAGSLGFQDLRLLDVGDIVEAHGTAGKTQRGEISVMTNTLRILTKTLRPLPDKWSGLKDREAILRKRYLDTISNPETKERFAKISAMLWEARRFLNGRGFQEFITPVLQSQYGGGTAKPFRTHVNALDTDMFLAISHELYLKRLIAAGYDKVFTIGRYFRNEGIDRSHHPEFSMIETMAAYENYEFSMELVESLFRHIATSVFGKTEFTVRGNTVDMGAPWRRVSMVDAVQQETGVDFRTVGLDDANNLLVSRGIEAQPNIGEAMVRMFEHAVEPVLIAPTLVYGHPMEISPLAKPMKDDPRFAERFEIFIGGMECGDNWSEQNDPVQLLAAWQRAYDAGKERAGEVHPLDYDFIEAMEYGIPPTTGIGPGIERMAMIFTEQTDIYDVIFFPMMKPVVSQANRAIYSLGDAPAGQEAPAE